MAQFKKLQPSKSSNLIYLFIPTIFLCLFFLPSMATIQYLYAFFFLGLLHLTVTEQREVTGTLWCGIKWWSKVTEIFEDLLFHSMYKMKKKSIKKLQWFYPLSKWCIGLFFPIIITRIIIIIIIMTYPGPFHVSCCSLWGFYSAQGGRNNRGWARWLPEYHLMSCS